MTDSSNINKCPFRATLITRSYSCAHANEITRRDGPDIGCDATAANQLCCDFFDALKRRALPELGFDDDLASMPASAVQKIQYGGVLGLHKVVEGEVNDDSIANPINNIVELIDSAYRKYVSLDEFPYDNCVEAIVNYKIKRRRGQ